MRKSSWIHEGTLIPPQAQGRYIGEIQFEVATRTYGFQKNPDGDFEIDNNGTVYLHTSDFSCKPCIIVESEKDMFFKVMDINTREFFYVLKNELF
jgi:hypothetical protein